MGKGEVWTIWPLQPYRLPNVGWAAVLGTGVDADHRIGGDLRVVLLDPILNGFVEFFPRGLIHDDRLGKRGRQRLRNWRRRFEEELRKWAVDSDGEGGGRLRARRSREGTQTERARPVRMKCEFGGVQMTSYIETAKDSIS